MNSATYTAKYLLNIGLRRFGYRIEKIVDPGEKRLDVFSLALKSAMMRVGSDFFFVQVGAHNGLDEDPIREFVVKYHLRGLLIEPQPSVFSDLQRNYRHEPQLRFENAAISCQDGKGRMYMAKSAAPPSSFLTTFRREVLESRVGRGTKVEELIVKTRTFPSLFAAHAVSQVDLLQVDAEGFDYEILRLFDFKTYQPALVRFEHINLARTELADALNLLGRFGYRFKRDGIDVLAVRSDDC